jgi:hypothetical protein
VQAYADFEHFGWPFRERLYEMTAAFVDEFRTVHLIVVARRGQHDADAAAEAELSPSEQRLRKARREMEAELGVGR